MPPAALGLVLAGALCHSAYNLLLKGTGARGLVSVLALLAGSALCAPALLWHPLTAIPPLGWALALSSGVLEFVYFRALTAAYAAGDLSLVYPIARGVAPVLTVPLAALVLGERPSAVGLAGIAVVASGIVAGHIGSLRRLVGAGGDRRAAMLAGLSGLMTACYSLVNKRGVALMPPLVWAALVFPVAAGLVWLSLLRAGGLSRPGGEEPVLRHSLGVGVFMTANYVAVLLAMQRAPVSYVVAVREVSIVLTPILASLILGEPRSGMRLASAAVIFAGVALIALSR
ncbi:MAG TPA: DMT family transporter [Candidatus Binatia bacterium]|nr:DMT family transporter [Candidatus Binatia bacterium]